MGFGFVVARFGMFLRELAAVKDGHSPHPTGISLFLGVALIALGVIVTLVAASEHRHIIGRLNRGEIFRPPVWSLGLMLSVVMALVGAAVAVYLLSTSL